MKSKLFLILTLFFSITIGVTPAAAMEIDTPAQLQAGEFVVSISSQDFSACALTSLGNVTCWGLDMTYAVHNTPYPILGLGVSRQIALGDGYGCALGSDEKVRCWGNNNYGQLGRDPSVLLRATTPLEVPGMTGVKSIAAGINHTCALKMDGSLYCWGNNQDGKIGNGNTNTQVTPFQVNLAEKMIDVAASKYNTCAIVDVTRSVYCWGNNMVGQVGIGYSSYDPILLPQRVSITSVKKITMDEGHVCAVTIANNVLCWGGNYAGELGYDPKLDQYPNPGSLNKDDIIIPIPVNLGAGQVLDVSAGHQFTCYVMIGGGVRCVGSNNGSLGTLGNAGYLIYTYQSVRVYNIRGGIAKLFSGKGTTYALTTGGSIYCWGACYRGDGSIRGDHTTPIRFEGLTGTPALGSNYPDGQDGSIFSISGQGFGEDLDVGLTINSSVLSPDMKIKTSSEGQFTFDLDLFGGLSGANQLAAARPDGQYTITMSAGGQSASTILKISSLSPKRAVEEPASLVTMRVPPGVNPMPDISVFLPLLFR